MGREHKYTKMVIGTRENLSMGFRKVLVNIFGLMVHFSKEISNREPEMAMVYGEA